MKKVKQPKKMKAPIYGASASGKLILTFDSEGEIYMEQSIIYIKLKNRKWRNKIAEVIKTESGKILRMTRSRSKHTFNNSNSYGFNNYICQKTSCENIHLSDEYGHYLVPVERIRSSGRYLQFKESGLETQIFLPISIIEHYRISDITP